MVQFETFDSKIGPHWWRKRLKWRKNASQASIQLFANSLYTHQTTLSARKLLTTDSISSIIPRSYDLGTGYGNEEAPSGVDLRSN